MYRRIKWFEKKNKVKVASACHKITNISLFVLLFSLRTIQLWSCELVVHLRHQIHHAPSLVDTQLRKRSRLQRHPAGWLQWLQYDAAVWLLRPLCEWFRPVRHRCGLCSGRTLIEDKESDRDKAAAFLGFLPHTPHHHRRRKHWPEDCGRWRGHSWRDTLAGTVVWDAEWREGWCSQMGYSLVVFAFFSFENKFRKWEFLHIIPTAVQMLDLCHWCRKSQA